MRVVGRDQQQCSPLTNVTSLIGWGVTSSVLHADECKCRAEDGGCTAGGGDGDRGCSELGDDTAGEEADALGGEQPSGGDADALAADAGRDDANEFGDDLHLVGGEGAAERPQQTRDG